jgi:hypothetical protein
MPKNGEPEAVFPNARVELIFIFLESNPDFKIENLKYYLTIIYGVIPLLSFPFT